MWLAGDDESATSLPLAAQRELYRYWCERRGEGGLPSRADIDPLDFPALLANIALIDVERAAGELRFRYRVYGTALAERAGRDLTGLWFEEAYDTRTIESDLAIYTEMVRRGQPFSSHRQIPDPEREYIGYHRLILPLASDGMTVDKILLLVIFD